MNVEELEIFLEEVIVEFDKQKEVFGDSFSLYGKGARAAYQHTLDMLRGSKPSAKEVE